MARLSLLLPALAALGFAGSAQAANLCSAPPLSCATTMPIGGYCECSARGETKDGTVVERALRRSHRVNSTAGGCGTHPDAPGCR